MVSELAPRLTKRGNEVYIYCHKKLFDNHLPTVDGIHLIYIPGLSGKTFSQLSHGFLSTLHVVFKKMDVILYVNTANGPFGLLTKLLGIKTIINVDGLEWRRPKWNKFAQLYFYIASFLSTKVFTKVVTDSYEMANIYKKEFNSPSTTIAYGANIGYSQNKELIEKYNVTPGNYYLIVGRLIPDNNSDLLVSAFKKSNIKKKLLIVGDVPYNDSYAKKIHNINDSRIILPGYIKNLNDLRELYCNSYVYLHGHEFGGTNPALLKALAWGCCVVALDTKFNREVLRNEDYGQFMKKDINAVVRVLEEIDINDAKVNYYREKARDRIRSEYTWDKIVNGYEDLFRNLTSK